MLRLQTQLLCYYLPEVGNVIVRREDHSAGGTSFHLVPRAELFAEFQITTYIPITTAASQRRWPVLMPSEKYNDPDYKDLTLPP
jgi:hypothetical protein